MNIQQHLTTEWPLLKELEEQLFRTLQKVFATLLVALLEEIDQQLAEARDKRRYQLKNKRSTTIQTLFGEVTFRRNYYYDRQTGAYTFLLDAELGFDGAQSISPYLEETAVELSVECSSYRKAARTLESIVGYAVMSHEAILQLVLEAHVSLHHPVSEWQGQVLFIEADGLFISRQGKGKRAKEEKILAVHEGWERNGSQLKLVNPRLYLHEGPGDVWERFEEWLLKEYAYDPCRDLLIINGDAASWIMACREYFGDRACFQLDRFHVASFVSACRATRVGGRGAEEAGETRRTRAFDGTQQRGWHTGGRGERASAFGLDSPDRVDARVHPGLSRVAFGARSGHDRNASDGPCGERDEPVRAPGETPPQLERPRTSGVSESHDRPNRRDFVEDTAAGGRDGGDRCTDIDESRTD